MPTLIKDLVVSQARKTVTQKLITSIRSNADLNRVINKIAGFPETNTQDQGKLPKRLKDPTKLVYPVDLDGVDEYDTYIKFTAIDYHHQKRKQSKADDTEAQANGLPQAAILLAHPQNLSVSYSVDWGTEELGVLGAGLEAAQRSGGGSIDKLIAGAKGAATQLKGKAIDVLAKQGAQNLGGNVEGVVSALRGDISNPYLKLLFKGIGVRQFQFSFPFNPRSEFEVLQSLAIFKSFKYYSAPYLGENNILMHYPSLWQINLMKRDKASQQGTENLFSFKLCACTNVSMNFTPNSVWSTFKNGKPVSFVMDLSFSEIDIVTRRDIHDPAKGEDQVGA